MADDEVVVCSTVISYKFIMVCSAVIIRNRNRSNYIFVSEYRHLYVWRKVNSVFNEFLLFK